MVSESLKVAVIGTGKWGVNHVRVLKKLSAEYNIELIVIDADASRAREVAEMFSVEKYYSDPTHAYAVEKFDAAVISAPTPLHYRLAREFIEKTDLLIEKPMAVSVEEAAEIVELAEKYDRVVAVGHIERFNPVVIAAKEEVDKRVDQGEKFLGAFAERVGVKPIDAIKYLGAAYDLMVHDLDVVLYLTQRLPRAVQAVKYPSSGYEDEVYAMYSFDDATCVLYASRRAKMKRRNLRMQLLSTFISIDYILQDIVVIEGVHPSTVPPDYFKVLAAYQATRIFEKRLLRGEETEPLLLEDRHFLDSVLNHRKPLVNEIDGYISVKSIAKTLEAAEKGRAISIEWNEPFIPNR